MSEPPRTQDNCLSGASARIDERNSALRGSGGTVSACLTISIVSLDGARMPGAIQTLNHLRQERKATEVADVGHLESCVPQNIRQPLSIVATLVPDDLVVLRPEALSSGHCHDDTPVRLQ